MTDRCNLIAGDDVMLRESTTWHKKAPRWMFWRRSVTSTDGPRLGVVYKVVAVGIAEQKRVGWIDHDVVVIRISGFDCWFSYGAFRKVQRRDLGVWLKTATKKSSKRDKREKAPA